MKLTFSQRLVVVLGIGAALLAVGHYIVGLGGPSLPVGWSGYAPLRLAAMGTGLSAGPRLAVWLVLTALWVAVSLFLLREPVTAGGEDASAPPAAERP